jgi:hypothetical protein
MHDGLPDKLQATATQPIEKGLFPKRNFLDSVETESRVTSHFIVDEFAPARCCFVMKQHFPARERNIHPW